MRSIIMELAHPLLLSWLQLPSLASLAKLIFGPKPPELTFTIVRAIFLPVSPSILSQIILFIRV